MQLSELAEASQCVKLPGSVPTEYFSTRYGTSEKAQGDIPLMKLSQLHVLASSKTWKIVDSTIQHESEIRLCLDSIGFLGLLGQSVTHGKIVVKLSPTKDVCDPCGGCPTSVHCRSWLAVSGAQGVPCCQERLSYVHVTHDLLQMAKLLKAP